MGAPREPYGYGQRSGKRIPLRRARYDGIVTGLQDAPEWVDDDHPQRHPVSVVDKIALERPLPRHESHSAIVHVGLAADLTSFAPIPVPRLRIAIGAPTLITPDVASNGWGANGWGSVTGWGGT